MSRYLLQVLIKKRAILPAALALMLPLAANAYGGSTVYSTGKGIKLDFPGQPKRVSATALKSAATVNTLAPTVLLSEDFESTFPSGEWTIIADGTSGCTWASTSAKADTGTNSASPVAAGCSPPTDVAIGPLPANAEILMSYGPFDLSGKSSASLDFRHAIQLEVGDSLLFGHINDADCSGSYTVNGISGGNLSWQSSSLDLFPQLGNTSVCVAFILVSNAVAAVGEEAVFLDNIVIVADDVDADPAVTLIDVSNGTFAPGDSITVRSVVENLGTESSAAYDIGFFLSPDNNVTIEDFLLGEFLDNPGIAAAGKDDFTDLIQLPTNLPAADWFIGASIKTTVDTDANNNANYDHVPIMVSAEGAIQVRPTTLKIFEQAPASPDAVKTLQSVEQPRPQKALVTTPVISKSRLQHLMRIAQKSKKVRLLVGINTDFAPARTLSSSATKKQREKISTTTDRLMADLRPFTTQLKNRFASIPYIALHVDESALIHLSKSPLVSSINEDTLSHPTMASSNVVIGTPLAWAEGVDGSGWAVAVLDTGVDKTHAWFGTDGGKIVSEACYGSVKAGVVESFCPDGVESSSELGSGGNCDLSVSGCGHGTHVAGIAAGNDAVGPGFGVARGADIIAIQVFSKFLTEADCGVGKAPCILSPTSDQVAALEHVLELTDSMDIAAVNMSLGGGRFFNQASCDSSEAAIKAIIDNLRAVGVATIVSSGNEGWDNSISAPACVSSAISVGATSDDDQVASFSNVYSEIDLMAPGVDIVSSEPGNVLGTMDGTSMSAPHVAGAWAVMQQRTAGGSVNEILAKLQNTASLVDDQRIGASETDLKRINLDLALGHPRSTFGIFNKGFGPLTVSSISPETPSAWISVEPPPPFIVQRGEMTTVRVTVDFSTAPEGTNIRRLLIESYDMDNNPFRVGVLIETTTQGTPLPEFVSNPVAYSTIAFGDVTVSTSSDTMGIGVQNTGDADLLMECSLSGANPDQFNIIKCPSTLEPANDKDISLTCSPSTNGSKSAVLNIVTNDSDEANVSFTVTCNGTDPASEEDIFADGFESVDI